MKIIHQTLRQITRPNMLPNALNIGLTGGIGSGKSTVARALQAQGAVLIDLDAIARHVTSAGGIAIDAIKAQFGERFLMLDGSLDRAAMRALIFTDASAKLKLEAITHPLITSEAVRQAHLASQQQPLCIVYDVPLLYGNHKWLDVLDYVVVVDCLPEQQVERVLARNPDYQPDTVQDIIRQQASREQLFAIADTLLDNSIKDASHLQVYTQVNILLEYIKYLSQVKLNQIKAS